MNNWLYLSVLVSAALLTLPRNVVPAAVYNGEAHELIQMRNNNDSLTQPDGSITPKPMLDYDSASYDEPRRSEKLNIGNQPPLPGQLSDPRNDKVRVFAEYQTGQRPTPDLQVQHDNNAAGSLSQTLSDTPATSLLFHPMKSLLSTNNRHLAEDKFPSLNKESLETSVDEHNSSSYIEQTTKITFQKVGETSNSLLKRLCAVHKKSKRQLCFQQGSSRCYCTGGLADCSGTSRSPNLSYAPKLQNSTCLQFEFNNVIHLDDSYFSNVSNFVAIDFSSNKLETISAKTFKSFTSLSYLMLNNNAFGYKYLRMVLDYPPKFRLDIVNLNLPEVPADYFKQYTAISTSQIYMDFSNMNNLDLREFAKLENLNYLSLANSSIQKVIPAPMGKLKVLDLSYNSISNFPITCRSSIEKSVSDSSAQNLDHQTLQGQKTSHSSVEISEQVKTESEENEEFSLFPVLTDLYIECNIIEALPPQDGICLPRLHNLNFQSNNITEIPESAFWALKSLKVLSLDKMNTGLTKIGRSAFNISTLTTLYLSRNGIQFNSKNISAKLFQGCSSLEVLSIDHNQLDGVSEDTFQELLNHTPALKYIYLGSSNMQIIPVKAFSQMKKLEKLFIYINSIKEIPPGAFDNMPSLHSLYMDQNELSTIKETSFSMETRRRLKLINLSKNKFLCNCDLLWFQSWLREGGPTQFMYFNDYLCSDITNMSVQKYSMSKQACLFSREVYALFVACLSIILVGFLVFAVVYRYRWNIRLMLYERRVPFRDVSNLTDQDRYRYDLFILYNNDDWEWVINRLLPKLEKQWRLKVCIHQRDFIAGGNIIDNTAEAMNASRRILAVVSPGFARSSWCNSELQLCQSHVITHDLPSLLVIILEKIERRDMRPAMLALYNTVCFLEWPSGSSVSMERDTFWRRLEKSLRTMIVSRTPRSQATSVKSVE